MKTEIIKFEHIGLFEGFGGFSFAAKQMGWNTRAWCEYNLFCQRVLGYHFPDAEGFGDIKKSIFKKYANKIDILTGGFPCQPFSTAGERKGIEDDRYLWPEMLRAIREIRPRWIVGENVHGIVNWNKGMVFDKVQTDLENEGYEVWPYILPAAGVDAWHRRERCWFIGFKASQPASQQGRSDIKNNSGKQVFTDTECIGSPGSGGAIEPVCETTCRDWKASWSFDDGGWPNESPICSGINGVPTGLDGITFSDWAQETMNAAGNAIVPQVAMQIFSAIIQYENLINGKF